ncbi:MAG: hypothetical protein LBF26_01135 [Puniceicoccales bacterium]|nr:hypothetical protein [Puniceicoccales bacterium]
MDTVKGLAQKAAAKLGISQDKVDYAMRLATNKIMLASIATIVVASLVFSPFFPLYWVALLGAVVGIVVAVRQTDEAMAAKKTDKSSESSSAAESGEPQSGIMDLVRLGIVKLASFVGVSGGLSVNQSSADS